MVKLKRLLLLLVLALSVSYSSFSDVVLTDEEAEEIDLALEEYEKDSERKEIELLTVRNELMIVSSELILSEKVVGKLEKEVREQELHYERQLSEARKSNTWVIVGFTAGGVIIGTAIGFGIAALIGAFK